jgi:DNA polymerase bacteriophage-type
MLSIDFETRSAVDLRRCGLHVYAECETTDALCMAYAFDGGGVKLWRRGEPLPRDVSEHVAAGRDVSAWNASFELAIWAIMARRHKWPQLLASQTHDPMARARAMGLPGALADCALALGVTQQKDKRGGYLIQKLSKPQRNGLFSEDPALLAEFGEYCKQDVRAERDVTEKLAPLLAKERTLWVLDHAINERGVAIDIPSVAAASKIVDDEGAHLNMRVAKTTRGLVGSASQIGAMLQFLQSEGVEAEKLTKQVVRDLLARGGTTEAARTLLELRKTAAKASTAKLKAMQRRACRDGRARGLLAFNGADTGRWAGRGIQTQNMTSPRDEKFDYAGCIEAINAPQGRDLLTFWYGSALDAVSWTMRAFIKAAPGRRFIACDYANIEGRVLAWIAGERWKLDAFRAFDAGTGPDLYKLAYHKSFGVPLDAITKLQRQLGKVQELALGYQGGVGAFASMAANYGIAVVENAADASPDASQVLTTAEADELKVLWRDAHPNVVKFWYGLQDAAMNATRQPGKVHRVGLIAFRVANGYLWMQLPSGRSLCYAQPRIIRAPRFGQMRDVLECHGTLKKSRKEDGTFQRLKWGAWQPYGGLFCENVCQAIARDLLAHAMPLLEAAGYPVVMHVHDEIVCEVPDNFGSVEDMEAIMCGTPAWAAGLPVVAEGWQGARYRK